MRSAEETLRRMRMDILAMDKRIVQLETVALNQVDVQTNVNSVTVKTDETIRDVAQKGIIKQV